MSSQLISRVHRPALLNKVMLASETVKFFRDGMTLGWSGFTPAGYPKVVPIAVADHVCKNNLQGKLKFNLMTGASVGKETANRWAELGMIDRLWPYQTGPAINKGINSGEIKFKDIHLSNFANSVAYGHLGKKIDIAIVEATEITASGGIVLGAAGGISEEVLHKADKVIIEVNTSLPSYKGMHDMIKDEVPPYRRPFLIGRVDDRIGAPWVRVDDSKVIAIVESRLPDNGRDMGAVDENSKKIADHLMDFFENEVKQKRLPPNLLPIQSGVGNIANAVVSGLSKSNFTNVSVWTEVVQDTMLDWFDTGKLRYASTTSVSLSKAGFEKFYKNWDFYSPKICIRPQAISNHPEIIRRLGLISMNTPVEVDMYGHVNSTHTIGSKIINGIGGSGDFLRNSYLPIIHTPSTRKTKTDPTGISCIVPFASHIDHTEHDVFVVVTEQ
eukprot:Ihof_evm3s423 gene=Ihof_evmTU3s423